MQQGLAHGHRQLSEAEDVYRRVLQQDSNYPDARAPVGRNRHQVNRNNVAEELIRRAVEIARWWRISTTASGRHCNPPVAPMLRSNCISAAIALEPPAFADAYANLGIATVSRAISPRRHRRFNRRRRFSRTIRRSSCTGGCLSRGETFGSRSTPSPPSRASARRCQRIRRHGAGPPAARPPEAAAATSATATAGEPRPRTSPEPGPGPSAAGTA